MSFLTVSIDWKTILESQMFLYTQFVYAVRILRMYYSICYTEYLICRQFLDIYELLTFWRYTLSFNNANTMFR